MSAAPPITHQQGLCLLNRKHLKGSPGASWHDWNNMVTGAVYCPLDRNIITLRLQTAAELALINARDPMDRDGTSQAIARLCGKTGDTSDICWIAPMELTYGLVELPNQLYIGSGAKFLDMSPIHIGERTLIGSNCSIFTGSHSIYPANRWPKDGKRSEAMGHSDPVWIGEEVWIGVNVTILGGVHIGDGVTIGAGSVVTRDIPERCVAVGNPCRIIRYIDDERPQTRLEYVKARECASLANLEMPLDYRTEWVEEAEYPLPLNCA